MCWPSLAWPWLTTSLQLQVEQEPEREVLKIAKRRLKNKKLILFYRRNWNMMSIIPKLPQCCKLIWFLAKSSSAKMRCKISQLQKFIKKEIYKRLIHKLALSTWSISSWKRKCAKTTMHSYFRSLFQFIKKGIFCNFLTRIWRRSFPSYPWIMDKKYLHKVSTNLASKSKTISKCTFLVIQQTPAETSMLRFLLITIICYTLCKFQFITRHTNKSRRKVKPNLMKSHRVSWASRVEVPTESWSSIQTM